MSSESSTRATRILTESVYPWAGVETSTIRQQLFAGDRSREDCLDPLDTAFEIERRDLRQRFRVFASRKEYCALPLFDLATAQEKADFQYLGRHWRRPAIRETCDASRELKITFIYQLTGEEHSMFDCVARHWIVRRRDERDRKFGGNWTEAFTDAWYFDSQQLAARFAGFSGDLVHRAFGVLKLSDERAAISHSGKRPTGLCALSETKTLHHIELPGSEVQEHTETSSVRVISIRDVSVPLSAFEPPKGFRKIPVYPSPFTMTRMTLIRRLKHFLQIST